MSTRISESTGFIRCFRNPYRKGQFVGVSAVYLRSSLQAACILMLFIGMENPRLKSSLYKLPTPSTYSGKNVEFPSIYGVQYSVWRGKFLLPACAILALLPIILSHCFLSLSLTQRLSCIV